MLVLIVLFLFLGNIWSALAAGIILPISVLGSFLLMYYFDITANLMSLGGLAISIGILVDSAVVVVENIHNFLQEPDHKVHKLNLVYRASKEVAMPVASAVLIIILSLIPIFMLTGIEGKLFRPLAITLGFALITAMVVALTIIPVISSLLMKKSGKGKTSSKYLDFLKKYYGKILNFILRHKKKAILAGFSAAILSSLLFLLIGKEFLPTLNEGTMVLQTEHSPTISLQRSLEDNLKLQKALMELPEIDGVVTRTGSDELKLDPMDFYQSDNYIVYAPRSQWKVDNIGELKTKMRKIIDNFTGIQSGFTQPIDMRVSEILTGVRAAIAIKLHGDNLNLLEEKSIEIEKLINETQGSTDVIRTPLKGQEYLQIEMNKKALGCQGVTVKKISNLIESAVGGEIISSIYKGNIKRPIFIRFPESVRNSAQKIANMRIKTPAKGMMRLGDLTIIKQVEGPLQISRENGVRQALIQCNVEGRDIVGFVNEIREKINKDVKLPSGYYVSFGGQFENQQRATKRILITVPLTILLIFIVLFLIFKSAAQALMIMLTIPLAFIGGIVLLYFAGYYLSISASIGFIALFGIAIENAIVMINYFNQLRETGAGIEKAVKNGASRRLRPVLMTAILTMLGLVPILLSSGPGSEIQKPLALVVFGGVFSSMILTLLILPAMYIIVEKKIEQKRKF
ncbi:MAG: efflux RND transporter permease subunit [Deltaproteobacteria bacterium]|nr:efflux RND transporter permease subunit [Deltaproteobacteria bacterium]